MAIETDITVAAQEALPRFASQGSASNGDSDARGAERAVQAAPEDGVTLTLSAQGRMLAAFASVVDAAAAAQAQPAMEAAPSAGPASDPLPITRATLHAIEARLVAARHGADAVAQADRERPDSADPARLKQAGQATESLYGRAPNPFAGLSRAELSAIVYDESGAYTVNERYAAANQRTELDNRFWAPVFQRALTTGDWRPVIEAGLAFYASLSPLERTAYPPNYAQLMQQYLALDSLQPASPLPPQQQADLVHMLESLVLPAGPLALAGGVIRGLVLPRVTPSALELIAQAPKLVDILPVSSIVRAVPGDAYMVLLQRVFGVARREDEPAVARRAGLSLQNRDFLSLGDRRYLADAYVYAAANGVPLEEVDALADDLAAYRLLRADDGHAPAGETAAGVAGSPAYARMSSDDIALARCMLGSRAARDTQLDHAFLAWLLSPRGGGWSAGDERGHAVGFSALEKLLAGLAGVGIDERAGDEASLESDYRYTLYRISLQEMQELPPLKPDVPSADNAIGARVLALAEQLAALARSEAADLAFMNNALMLLRMYRFSLKMSDAEQRTLAELVYASLRKRRIRSRRGKLFVAWGERNPWMPALPS
ncbi:hypothetical protein [Herbaspirillum sp.]|uniref:hypothetical protein n=1 Tax=Herbaspirillum sp. TaxID=1890675 RepID=UPI001B063AAB|nr:hypothetical protein [Herbaspirillum sp.]MBO9537315.1 hypothetical protein [Herbaspirillum sp.]